MWEAWAAGDRRRALELEPDSVIDELFVHGTPSTCRHRIGQYFTNGLTAVSLSILGVTPTSVAPALGVLAPNADNACTHWADV